MQVPNEMSENNINSVCHVTVSDTKDASYDLWAKVHLMQKLHIKAIWCRSLLTLQMNWLVDYYQSSVNQFFYHQKDLHKHYTEYTDIYGRMYSCTQCEQYSKHQHY